MSNLGIFFGSDTGNTRNIAYMIYKKFNARTTEIFDISDSKKENIEDCDNLILGIPTWYYGEAQCDWEDFLPIMEDIDFKGKNVAIFGCGDQEDYSEYFCDAMSILGSIVIKKGAKLTGKWSTQGYNFKYSKSVIENNKFIGLAIDEDRQADLTDKRVNQWVKQIKIEMNL